MVTIYAWRGFLFNGWKENLYNSSCNDICNSTQDYGPIVKSFSHEDMIAKYTTVLAFLTVSAVLKVEYTLIYFFSSWAKHPSFPMKFTKGLDIEYQK